MAKITTLRTRLTAGRLDVIDMLKDCLAEAECNPQCGVAVVMLSEDDEITAGYAFASRLALKGALIHAIGEID